MKKFLITISPLAILFFIVMFAIHGITGAAIFVLFAIVFYLFYKWVEFIDDKFED